MLTEFCFHLYSFPGVDDAETECGLDSVNSWNVIIDNNHSEDYLEEKIDEILNWVKNKLSS